MLSVVVSMPGWPSSSTKKPHDGRMEIDDVHGPNQNHLESEMNKETKKGKMRKNVVMSSTAGGTMAP